LNTFEIESSQMALNRTKADKVDAFAKHMIDDHSAAAAKMKAAAAKDGITLSATMVQKDQAQLAKLQATDGQAFDQAYLAAQVTAHDQAVALFGTFSTKGQESALRTLRPKRSPLSESTT